MAAASPTPKIEAQVNVVLGSLPVAASATRMEVQSTAQCRRGGVESGRVRSAGVDTVARRTGAPHGGTNDSGRPVMHGGGRGLSSLSGPTARHVTVV